MTAITRVCLNVVVDQNSQIVNLDEVVAQGQATALLLTLTNTL